MLCFSAVSGTCQADDTENSSALDHAFPDPEVTADSCTDWKLMMCQQLKTSEYFRIAQKESGLAPQAAISCCSGINIGKIMELSKRQGYFMPGDLDDRTDLQQAEVTAIVNLGLIMSDDRTDLR